MQVKPLKEYPSSGKLKIILLGLVVIFCWSTPFTATSIGLQGFSPYSMALLRFIFASVLLIIIGIIKKLPLPKWKDVPELAAFGLVYFVLYNLTLNNAQKTIPASITSIFFAFGPAVVLIMASVMMKERIPGFSILGLAIAIFGVLCIILRNGFGKIVFGPEYFWLIGAIFFSSLGTILQKHLVERFTSLEVMVYSMPLAVIMMMWALPGLIRELPAAPAKSIFAVFYLGSVPGLLGLVVWGEILKRIPAGEAEVFLCADTPGAVLVAWILLGEKPGAIVWFGLLIIILGMFMVSRGSKRKKAA